MPELCANTPSHRPSFLHQIIVFSCHNNYKFSKPCKQSLTIWKKKILFSVFCRCLQDNPGTKLLIYTVILHATALIYWVAPVLLVQQNKNGILGTRSAKKYCSSLKIQLQEQVGLLRCQSSRVMSCPFCYGQLLAQRTTELQGQCWLTCACLDACLKQA